MNETFTPAWLAAISAAAIKATKGKVILDDSDVDVKNFLRTRGGELITVLSEESKKAVAMVILRGQAEKVLPKKIAQQIRPLIGLNERQAQANMTYRQRVYQNLLASGLPPVTAEARAAKAALRYAGKQHRERADMIVNTELAFAYNRGADIGIKRAIKDGFMGRCEMVWTTAGTNRVCQRCLALKDKVVGHTDEDGVTLPPLHPRCRCAIIYREVGEIKPTQRVWKPTATAEQISAKLKAVQSELGIKGELVYPPPKLDLSAFKFDAAHTQGDKHPHDVTEEEARRFIKEAYFTITRYNGASYNYYGKEGAAFVRTDLQTIRTAFKAAEYDEKIRRLIEVYENETNR